MTQFFLSKDIYIYFFFIEYSTPSVNIFYRYEIHFFFLFFFLGDNVAFFKMASQAEQQERGNEIQQQN